MEHLFYTWCQPGHSLSGGAGWGIRALSSGLPEHEGQQLVPAANYQFLDSVDPADAPVRLAYLKHASLGNIVVHGTPIGLCPGNTRSGNYFTHCLSKLDENFDGFKAICLWDSPDWVREDFDTDPPYEEKNAGMSKVIADPPSEIFEEVQNRLKSDPAFYENALHCLESFLALEETKKLHIAGSSPDIADLIKVIGACLPPTERKELTFSTYDNPDAPPEVKILGCFFADPNREDLPEYHYQEGFFTLNTYTDRKSAAPPLDDFARNILNVLRDYGESRVEELHNFIEKYNLHTTEAKRPLWGLYPPEGQPISVDDSSILHIFSWPTGFLNDLPTERREELVAWVRANVSPKSILGDPAPKSRDWIIHNLSLLKELALESEQTRGLLTELFEDNEIQVSMEYVNAFEGYLDSSIAENARSRALYELGKFIYLEQTPPVDPDSMARLASYCLILEQELNALPWDGPNRLNSLLWQRLIWGCHSQKDFESLYKNFHFLVPGGEMQGFQDRVADCLCNFCPNQLPAKLEPLLNLTERHALEIPEQTLGAKFCAEDELFYQVFYQLNSNTGLRLPRTFHNDNDNSDAVCFFVRYYGDQFEQRFKNLVDQDQLTPTNFDQLRNIVHGTDPEIGKRVDNYILYEYSAANPAYQSLYNDKLKELTVDDLLDVRIYNFCVKLQGTCATEQSHSIMGYLGVHQLAQKDNWNYVRDEKSREDFFRRYHRLSERTDAVKFCELYADYIYEGLDRFTALESYLGFNPSSRKPEDEAFYVKTKLNLLKVLVGKISQTNPNQPDPQRKKSFAAIWFYCTCLLPDGTTGLDKKSQYAEGSAKTPLIDFDWLKKQGLESEGPHPETHPDIRDFVENHFNRTFFEVHARSFDKEDDLRKKMQDACERKHIEHFTGQKSFGKLNTNLNKLRNFWIAIGIATVLAIALIIKTCSSRSAKQNDSNKPQPASEKDGERKDKK